MARKKIGFMDGCKMPTVQEIANVKAMATTIENAQIQRVIDNTELATKGFRLIGGDRKMRTAETEMYSGLNMLDDGKAQ